MSRIGNRELTIPAGTTVTVENNLVTVKGAKGELKLTVKPVVNVEVKENAVVTTRINEEKHTKQLHGTYNSLISGMIEGVTNGYKKELEINGVGYRAKATGNKIDLSLGFSHPVVMEAPEGITVETPSNTEIIVSGIDKQKVGQFAAEIRA